MLCSCESCHINNTFYSSIRDANLERFCHARTEIIIPGGTTFINQGDDIKSFKYLKEGLVKLHRQNEIGKEQIISFGTPMDFISVQNVFSEKKYNYSVTAIENSVVCVFDLKIINDLILSNGEFAMKMLNISSMAMNKILNSSLDMISRTMYGKVASLLVFFQDHVYKTEGFDLPVSRKEIAQYTGLSIETVIRVISELRKDGLIKVFGKKIEITNKQALLSIIEHS
ncbi:MAG: Crp/Fnr family transcriptional regulator [Deltaproteobacteria bacterium]